MSPEQVRGERGDARTDVYALGVMLYEMLVGKVPYPGDNALVVLNRRVTTDPPLVRRYRPDASPAVEAVIYRALRRDPAERYASMAALRHDLDHLDEVAIPDYTPDWARPPSVGPMPSAKTAIMAICIVFAILAAIGMLAELAHRGQLGR
jgi:serine/threonine-protein kinase